MDQELARPAGPAAGGAVAPAVPQPGPLPGARPTVIRASGALTAALALSGVALQLWLSIAADEHGYGPVGESLHLLSFFTITANLVVGVVHALLAQHPERGGVWFHAMRLAGLVMITVTGLVYWALLAGEPLAGADWLANMLLHTLTPLAAVASWAWASPAVRLRWSMLPMMLVIPVLWLLHALLRGAISGYYAYFFMDVATMGYGAALANIGLVILVALALATVFVGIDRLRARRDARRGLEPVAP
ncbi:MAG TPA: Pr6Pr family membrane protein [Candidatus Nanopelagicales bacterium]